MRTRLHVDIYVVIYGRELARCNSEAVAPHLRVYSMRQGEGMAQQFVLFMGQCKDFVTRHSRFRPLSVYLYTHR